MAEWDRTGASAWGRGVLHGVILEDEIRGSAVVMLVTVYPLHACKYRKYNLTNTGKPIEHFQSDETTFEIVIFWYGSYFFHSQENIQKNLKQKQKKLCTCTAKKAGLNLKTWQQIYIYEYW